MTSYLTRRQMRHLSGFLFIMCLSCCAVYLYMRLQKSNFGHKLGQQISGNLSNWNDIRDESVNAQACQFPELPYWNKYIENNIRKVKPHNCEQEKEWVFTKHGNFYISNAAEEAHGDISCTYTPYVNDKDGHKALEPVVRFANGSKLQSDAFKVKCNGTDGTVYKRFHPCIVQREGFKKQINQSNVLNVMMLGIDSLSRMMVMRLLPKTFEYFTNHLKGAVLHGYNILGDGTAAALMPMLTGEQENEVAEVRRGKTGAVYVDEALTFIWKRFEKKGYVTQWAEDDPQIGTFNLRMCGFKDKPVHHYMRTFYTLAVHTYGKFKKLCYGSKERHNVLLHWLKEGLNTNRGNLFFTLGFLSEVSHNNKNLVQLADEDIVDFMKFMKKEGFLQNTIFILFSDHGSRVGKLRATKQGRLEEKMPFVGLHLPDKFKNNFPNKFKELQMNKKLLTSPFDIHETLIDVLNEFTDTTTCHTGNRGRSLLRKIPMNRTCMEAGISPHYCVCIQWGNVSVTNNHVIKVVDKIVEWINTLLDEYPNVCHTLKLHSIKSAFSVPRNMKESTTIPSKYFDSRALNGSDKFDKGNVNYQVTFQTIPGMGVFETTVEYRAKTGQVITNVKDVSRLNTYGKSSACIKRSNPKLMAFCVCK